MGNNMKIINIIVPDLDVRDSAGTMKIAEPVVVAVGLPLDHVAAILAGVYMQVAKDFLRTSRSNRTISYQEHSEIVDVMEKIHEKYISKYIEENLFNNENENPIS